MTTPHEPDQPDRDRDDPDRDDPDRDRAELDEAFRRIVEGYGERAVLEPDEEQPPPDPDRLRRLFRDPLAPVGPAGHDEREDREDRADPDAFVPPDPPPVPRGTPLRRAAWFGMLGVPALVVALLLVGLEPPRFLLGCLLAWFLAGAVYLFATMRRTDDDGWGDGAVV